MPTIEQIRLFFEAVGILQIILGALVPIIGFVFWIFGIFPLFKRFGLGRWFRKIDIAADQSSYACLESDLLATGIFRKKNINPILPTNISKVADSSLLLINYNSFSVEEIRKILSYKKTGSGFIFYFPEFDPPKNIIPPEIMKEINSHPFTIVVNCRGRLINDIMTTLLSTSYDKR